MLIFEFFSVYQKRIFLFFLGEYNLSYAKQS